MRSTVALIASMLLLMAGPSARADEAEVVAAKVVAAMNPAGSSTRRIEMTIKGPDGAAVEWSGRQARKVLPSGKEGIVTVLMAPQPVSGFALLSLRSDDAKTEHWMYLPPVRRVRKIIQSDIDRHFLGTDFTLADLAFFDFSGRKLTLATDENVTDKKMRVLREMPDEPLVYSKIETWVSVENWLAVRRDFYDRAGALWRKQELTSSAVIEGKPTILGLSMTDIQQGGSSELKVTEVTYDKSIPDKFFDPINLPEVSGQVDW